MRYGAVSYLNARPLLEGLDPLILDTPARLVERFHAGELDVALLPVAPAEAAGLTRVGGLGVAAEGPVDSVLLFLRRPVEDVRTLRLDPDSCTSNTLAQVLLREAFRIDPEVVEGDADADAEVVIGDAALVRATDGGSRLDLAEAWTWHSGLPFVFAAWYGDPAAEAALSAAYERGKQRLADYAAEAALGLPAKDLETYLRERVRYRLGDREIGGLRRFLETARRLSLL